MEFFLSTKNYARRHVENLSSPCIHNKDRTADSADKKSSSLSLRYKFNFEEIRLGCPHASNINIFASGYLKRIPNEMTTFGRDHWEVT